jgi:hypothetical protein
MRNQFADLLILSQEWGYDDKILTLDKAFSTQLMQNANRWLISSDGHD